jgi:hypothetical protein
MALFAINAARHYCSHIVHPLPFVHDGAVRDDVTGALACIMTIIISLHAPLTAHFVNALDALN